MPINIEDALYPRRSEQSDPLAQALRYQQIQSAQEQQALRNVQAQNALASEARAAAKFQQEQQAQADRAAILRQNIGPGGELNWSGAIKAFASHPLLADEAKNWLSALDTHNSSVAQTVRTNLESDRVRAATFGSAASGLLAKLQANGGKLENSDLIKVVSAPEFIAACGGAKQATDVLAGCPRKPDGSIDTQALIPTLKQMAVSGLSTSEALSKVIPTQETVDTPGTKHFFNVDPLTGARVETGKLTKGLSPQESAEYGQMPGPSKYIPSGNLSDQNITGNSVEGEPTQQVAQAGEGSFADRYAPFEAKPFVGPSGLPVNPEAYSQKQFRRASAKEALDMQKKLPDAIQAGDAFINAIDRVYDSPGKAGAVGKGAYNPLVYLPNTDERNFTEDLKELQGKIFKQAFESLRGGGQIVTYEEKAAQNALANLSRAKTVEKFNEALIDLRNLVREIQARNKQALELGGVHVRPLTSDERKLFNSKQAGARQANEESGPQFNNDRYRQLLKEHLGL